MRNGADMLHIPLKRSSWNVIVLDETVSPGRVYANDPALHFAVHKFSKVPGTVNMYEDDTGFRLPAPQLPAPQSVKWGTSSAQSGESDVIRMMPPVETATGPYRRLIAKSGPYISMDASLQLAATG